MALLNEGRSNYFISYKISKVFYVIIVVENGKRIASFSISMKLSVHDKHEKQTKTDTIRYCDM